jgi:hypothetical protein
LAFTQPRGAPGACGFVCLPFKTGPKGRFLNGLPRGTDFFGGLGLLSRSCRFCLAVSFSFDCHAPVRPFAFLSRFGDLLSRFASPAGGYFLLRQKVTKERPGILPGPGEPAKGSGLGRMTHGPPELTNGWRSVAGSTLIYYQRLPTDSTRRLGCVGGLELCSCLLGVRALAAGGSLAG